MRDFVTACRQMLPQVEFTTKALGLKFQAGREPMIDDETLKSIATQLMTSTAVSVDGKFIPVRTTSRQPENCSVHSRRARTSGDRRKPGEAEPMGQLARSGHKVVQFKDAERNKFVAVVVDGEVMYYEAGKKRQ